RADLRRIVWNDHDLVAFLEGFVELERVRAKHRHAAQPSFDAATRGKPVEATGEGDEGDIGRENKVHLSVESGEKVRALGAIERHRLADVVYVDVRLVEVTHDVETDVGVFGG